MTVRTRSELITLARVVANETAAGANTAARIGGLLEDLADSLQSHGDGTERLVVNEIPLVTISGDTLQTIRAFTAEEWPEALGANESRRIVLEGYETTTNGTAVFQVYHPDYGNGNSVSIPLVASTQLVLEFRLSRVDEVGVISASSVAICGGTVRTRDSVASQVGVGNWPSAPQLRVQLGGPTCSFAVRKIQLWSAYRD